MSFQAALEKRGLLDQTEVVESQCFETLGVVFDLTKSGSFTTHSSGRGDCIVRDPRCCESTISLARDLEFFLGTLLCISRLAPLGAHFAPSLSTPVAPSSPGFALPKNSRLGTAHTHAKLNGCTSIRHGAVQLIHCVVLERAHPTVAPSGQLFPCFFCLHSSDSV